MPAKTRQAVLLAASELGYKSFPNPDLSYTNYSGKKVLLLSANMLMNIPFHIHVMRGLENELSAVNMSLLRNLPTVFLDFTQERIESSYRYDVVMMENFNTIKEYCTDLYDKGACKNFGFVGDIRHCLAFYERYLGMQCALLERGIPLNPRNNILADNNLPYNNLTKLTKLIRKCELPDCFICANDFLALTLLDALNMLGIQVPEQIKIIGFENSAESKISKPTLSTININKINLGKELMHTLLNRMKNRQQRTRFLYIKDAPVCRDSTNML